MSIHIVKGDLDNASKFRKKLYEFIIRLKEKYNNLNFFNLDELADFLLSACRMNEFNILSCPDKKILFNEELAEQWFIHRLLPNSIVMDFNDEDIIRLLLFCLEITYQMFEGGTKATVSAKGFREKGRTFESIVVDQFNGKVGEIILKRFLENKFKTNIELDWEISRNIEKYRNDIMNAKKLVSIKTTNSLTAIWAEADKNYDYGITIKCSVPEPTILQFFIEVCAFSKFLNFADSKIPVYDEMFRNYIEGIRDRIKEYKCGEMVSKIKGFVCGYFETSNLKTASLGDQLAYFGEVKEERYLIPISKLKYSQEEWLDFLIKTGLMKD